MIFDCHFLHAIVINRLSIQINRHLSTPIDCTTSSGHSTIRLFPQSIAQRRPAIRLFPQSIAQRRPAIRSFPQSIAQRHPTIRLFPQSIAQGLPPGLGCVAPSVLGGDGVYSSSLYFSTTSFFFFLQSTYNPLDFK